MLSYIIHNNVLFIHYELFIYICYIYTIHIQLWASLVPEMVKGLPEEKETQVQSLGWEGPLQKGMATHSSIIA